MVPAFIFIDEDGDLSVEWINGDHRVLLTVSIEDGKLAYDMFKTFRDSTGAIRFQDIDVTNTDAVSGALCWIKGEPKENPPKARKERGTWALILTLAAGVLFVLVLMTLSLLASLYPNILR